MTESFSNSNCRSEPSTALDGRHVLLVEDDPTQQRIFYSYLKQEGIEVTLENNGLAGIDNVNKHPNRYDLLITDIEMPFMTGIEFARELRERGTLVPILAISGRHSVGLERECWQAGCDAYLIKPFVREQMITQVRRLVAVHYRRQHDSGTKELIKFYDSPAYHDPTPDKYPTNNLRSVNLKATATNDDQPELVDPMRSAIEQAIEKLNRIPANLL